MASILTILHTVAFVHFVYGIYYDLTYLVFPASFHMNDSLVPMKGRLKFLTFWDMRLTQSLTIYIEVWSNFKMLSVHGFHSSAFVLFAFALWYDFMHIVVDPIRLPKGFRETPGGRSRFFTYWNLLLQTFYFGVALLNDFVGSNENVSSKLPLIRRFKDFVFCSLAFPLAMFVGISFWALMAVDRELVFPKALDEFFPSWLNHVMHTNIVIFIALEMFLTYRQYPPRKSGITCLAVLLLIYLAWVHVIYYHSGYWVYPILAVLNWPLKIAFYLVLIVLMMSLYYFGEYANNKVWGRQASHSKRSGKRKSNKD